MAYRVTLTKDESACAISVALYQEILKLGESNAPIPEMNEINHNQISAEFAICKAMNLFPNLNETSRILVGHQHTPIEVIWSQEVSAFYQCLAEEKGVVVVVTGQHFVFEIQGWTEAAKSRTGIIYQADLKTFNDSAWYKEIT